MIKLKTLFIDIGGVIMTNGWDRTMRQEAVEVFKLDQTDFDQRHRSYYDQYESDKISLSEYLKNTVFYKNRSFSEDDFKEFMFSKSKPYPDVIGYFTLLKTKHPHLRIAAISNEGRSLADYRIKIANLKDFIDDFFISGYLGIQKPNPLIYKIALDVTQTSAEQAFYIDDRKELVVAAANCGIKGIQQTSLKNTMMVLSSIISP